MKRLFPVVVVLLVLGFCARASAQDVSELSTLRGEPEKYIRALSDMISGAVEQNDLATAISLLDYFDAFPDCDQAGIQRYQLAVRLNRQKDFQTAADLLQKNVDLDPWGRYTPQSIELLVDVLANQQGRREDAQYLESQLATYYYAEIPCVAKARASLGAGVPAVPRNRMVLLDASLSESSITDRCATGSCGFGQFEVIKILVGAGYVVHSNDTVKRPLTSQTVSQYGLIIMNGRYGGTDEPPIPQAVIDTLANYVKEGGSLLVVASGAIGSGKTADFYNPLMDAFGLHFSEGVAGRDVDCVGRPLAEGKVTNRVPIGKPAGSNPASLSDFYIWNGTSVTSDRGMVLGQFDDQRVIVAVQYGKGRVIAAGIGPALCGGGMCFQSKPEYAEMGKNLLLKLTAYLLPSR